jgi:hypothetical protein
MDSQSLQRIKELLSRSQRVAVAVGKNPSIDDMGAALALYLSLQSMGKSASIVSATEPIVEISNLVGIDKVKTTFESGEGADLVVSFPYKEGEIEKVSYTIENGFLNIVVKAGEQGLNFAEHEVKYARGGGDGQLDVLFVVGTPHLSDIQNSFGVDMLKDVTVVNIDNKQENQGYGDVVLVSPRFSSISEQMTQLMNDLQLDMDVDIAQNLMDGIMFGTENFQSPRTSFLAFEMAGVLMRLGAIRSRVTVGRPAQQQPQQNYQPQFNQPQQLGQQQPQQQPRRQQQNQPRQQHGQDRRQQNQPRQQQNQQRPQQQFEQPRPQQFNQPQQQGAQQQFEQPRPQQQPQFEQPRPQPAPAMPEEPGLDDVNPPSDWLTPKVYKGSSNV